jgi:hypothetical protein
VYRKEIYLEIAQDKAARASHAEIDAALKRLGDRS